jgi:cation:H+ antiporter
MMLDSAPNPAFLQNIAYRGKRKLAFVLLLRRIKSKLRIRYVYRLYAARDFLSVDRRVYLKKGLLMLLATALLIIGLLLVVYSADRLVFSA